MKKITVGYLKPMQVTVDVDFLLKKHPEWGKWLEVYSKDFMDRTDAEDEYIDENPIIYQIVNCIDPEVNKTKWDEDCEILEIIK